MDTSQAAINRAGQKETLVVSRSQIDHVRHALKGLHITSYFPRTFPEGDRTSGMCAIDILYPPHADETRDGDIRKIKVPRGALCIKNVSPSDVVSWVWGETTHGGRLGRPPA